MSMRLLSASEQLAHNGGCEPMANGLTRLARLAQGTLRTGTADRPVSNSLAGRITDGQRICDVVLAICDVVRAICDAYL